MAKIFLDPKKIKKMYETVGKRDLKDEVLLRIMGNTGIRVSDARSLLVDNVYDVERDVVLSSIRIKMKKTGKYVERTINEATQAAIRRYLPSVFGTSIYLFPGNDTSKPIGRTYCHELFKRALREIMPDNADLRGASTHTLRRSVAMLIADETSIQVASSFLGHKSIASTTAYLSQEQLGREAEDFMSKRMNF